MHNTSPANTKDQTIHIRMLGGFSITQGDLSIGDDSNRTKQLWRLLAYLIANRHKEVSKDELTAVLWPDRTSENPVNALKNLVYRLRVIFEDYGFSFAKEMILLSHGGYRWNNRLPCVIDLERLEQAEELCRTARPEQLRALLEILSLYQGELLCGVFFSDCLQLRADACRTIFLQGVYRANELMIDSGQLSDAQLLCEWAIELIPLDEKLHSQLIRLLLRQDRQEQALEHYNQTVDLFYRMVRTPPSEEIRALYHEITHRANEIETDLDAIKEILRENEIATGAFYCDSEVFKDIYRVEARSASRTLKQVFVGLLTVTDARGGVPERELLSVVMDRLKELIRTSLRKGDVFCRFSAAQYMIMLPSQSFEAGYMVLGRICKRFRRDARCKELHVQAALQPLEPVQSDV